MASRKLVTQCTDAEWKAMVNRVKSCCPPPEGYDWRFTRTASIEDNDNGECTRKEGKDGKRGVIVVRVRKGMSESETVDTLIHEVAHGYDMWTHHSWAGDHSDTFFLWYGRVYRRYWGSE